ncbi:hypothetical protein [Lentibacillus amyloliquefaciens]|nr:hypothetical protein [Lentibacillus amyloliquefaciens]
MGMGKRGKSLREIGLGLCEIRSSSPRGDQKMSKVDEIILPKNGDT